MSTQPARTVPPLLESIGSGFDSLPRRDAAGLGPLRREALDAALADGLPPSRNEAWKYTSLRALERRSFAPATDDTPPLPAVDRLGLPDGLRLVFVNGRFDAALSRLDGLPEGLRFAPLSTALDADDAATRDAFALRFERGDEVFARLNTALAVEGVLIDVPEGAVVETPLHVVHIGTASGGDRAWHLRVLVALGEAASLTLVEHQLGALPHGHLANTLTQLKLARGARLVHVRVQSESERATLLLRTEADLGEDANYRRLDLELGGALSRHELNVTLSGDRAALSANGVLLADGRRHVDTRLGIDHVARDTSCDLTWRGLAGGRGRAVFHGGILIREGADGTRAELANKNLLLSEGAEIDTQPVLVIHADEVEAAHGATVGQIDPVALFYLRSRGLPEVDARQLLTRAFCREPLAVIDDDELRETLSTRLEARLGGVAGA